MDKVQNSKRRVFLFLQGPHGPFFSQLAQSLRRAGQDVLRIGFNAGDQAFWPDRKSYISYTERPEHWPDRLGRLLAQHAVTDLVLYGDMRSVHAQAIAVARAQNLQVHVFEEGYMRPYWVTYERDGSNGNSRLMDLSLSDISALNNARGPDQPIPPAHWGDMRQHIFYGAAYHWFVMFLNRRYGHFRPHRNLSVAKEFQLYLKRLILMPVHSLDRRLATARVRMGSVPYHLVMLQLEHDSAFQHHGPFPDQRAFLAQVMEGFAHGAPAHHHLVFKAHPLEDDRTPLRAEIRQFAREYDVFERVHFVRGGKLASLLNEARSAITVNSTAGQQALWRGIPLRAFGASVYSKPELVSDQSLDDFFADPRGPDAASYRAFRAFLLATSQLPGSFYAAKGRRQLLRQLPDLMLRSADPYALEQNQNAADRQQLRLVT